MTEDANWIDIVDVSAAQGTVDFARVAAVDVAPGVARKWRGAYIKVSEGETSKDPTRAQHIANARAAGLAWGAYTFIHPLGDIAKQVQNAYEAIGDTMPDFPLGFDLEAADPSLTDQYLTDCVRRARDASLETFGRACMPYHFPDFFTRRMMPAVALAADLADLYLWWANYGTGKPWYPTREQLPRAPDPWRAAGKPITLWQASGNTVKTPGAWDGHVAGVNGDVDRSVFTGTEDEFLYDFCGRPRADQLEEETRIVHPTDLT